MNKPIDDDKISQIRSLYEKDELAKHFFDWAANRQRDSAETPVRVAAYRLEAEPSDLRELFQAFAEIGIAEFKTGRRGKETRAAWNFSLRSIGKAAQNQSQNLEKMDLGGDDIDDEPSPSTDAITSDFLKHSYQLRPNLVLEFRLPHDFTAKEADRVSTWIKSLPFE